MGYTHYWTHKKLFSKDDWAEILTGMHFLYEHAHENGIALLSWNGEDGVPEATATEIAFNGAGDDSHESLVVHRQRQKATEEDKRYGMNPNWAFCKTARKPYDLIVTALLAYLDSIHPEKFEVSSDGRTENWTAGVELARKAWPNKANQIQVPREVRDTDRYARYHDSSKLYQIATDHAGQMWIERIGDRHRIRLEDGWYDGMMKNLRHSMRKYGSFRGNESSICATRRLNHMWLILQFNDKPIEKPDTFTPLPA